MWTVKTIPVNMLEENCYIVSDETQEAVIIDCGALSENDRRQITDYVSSQQLQVKHHLCTHMHYDHCFGTAFLWENYRVAPEFHPADEPLYKGEASEFFGQLARIMQAGNLPKAGRFLQEGDEVHFGNHTLKVLHTPGHSPGGICFYSPKENTVFVGDTLFYCSVGRSDLPGGDTETLCKSILKKLFTLPPETIAYPGHGPKTQIGFEKQYNPYVC